MTNDEIKELIVLVNESGIFELEVQNGDSRVRIRRSAGGSDQQVVLPAVLPVSVGSAAPSSAVTPIANPSLHEPAALPSAPADDERNTLVKSPIVGTYYDAPSPGAPQFVKVGDHVHPKQVLCIIESMKLMNEIEAEISGIVVAKFVESGRPVEYGEALFSIRPA
jgi:acetyl-CoA carboxylase biotin carboxyl carrier protein